MKLSPVKHSRYIPTTASTTATQTAPGTFLCRNIPRIGVRIMYSVVMNPPLPTVVMDSPYCCRVDATVSASPQAIPPMMVVLRGRGFRSAFGVRFRSMSITGISTAPPIRLRTPLNVSGPMESMPAFCDTNAIPHITAAVRSSRQFRNFCVFVMC